MTLPDPPSLTPEERELAQRLARLGPHGEPSPALDARILAAAHATAAPTPVRLPRRWPMALGLAASLVLAVGIAWRLRPLPETQPAYRSEAVSAVRMESPSAPAPAPAPVESASADSIQSAPADPGVMDSGAAAKPQASEPSLHTSERTDRFAAAASAAQEPAVVFDEPAPPSASATAAAKAADVPAPTAAPPSVAGKPQAFGTATPTAPAPANAAAGSDERQAAPEANQTGMTRDAVATPAARGDEPLDDIPPATADAPAVRDAWLQRIRGLADAGDLQQARASLREFARRYPTFPLPDDLRALGR